MDSAWNWSHLLMKNGERKINPIIIVFIVFQIVFIILLIYSFSLAGNSDKTGIDEYGAVTTVSIEGIKDIADYLSDGDITYLEGVLFNSVSDNVTDNTSVSVPKATIRESYIKKFDLQNFTLLNMTVDISELEQSYQVFYFYSDDLNNSYISKNEQAIVICVSEENEIYNFDCNDQEESNETRKKIAKRMLELTLFEEFTISIEDDIVNISLGDITENKAIEEVKATLSEMGFNEDMFSYYIMKDSDWTFNMD